MTKHTPGPWTVTPAPFPGNHWVTIDAPKGDSRFGDSGAWEQLAAVYGSLDQPELGTEIMRANATLIAAAPELLEALRGLAESVRRMALRLNSEPGNQIAVRLWMDRLEDADAAIAKAEGR